MWCNYAELRVLRDGDDEFSLLEDDVMSNRQFDGSEGGNLKADETKVSHLEDGVKCDLDSDGFDLKDSDDEVSLLEDDVKMNLEFDASGDLKDGEDEKNVSLS